MSKTWMLRRRAGTWFVTLHTGLVVGLIVGSNWVACLGPLAVEWVPADY